ncbi:MAG: cytochrome c biogenesis protein ResB [Phycisphaerae bacterium]|nr:cytochrome c biogenesis protein ResB [Phycisphaerae bacterium]
MKEKLKSALMLAGLVMAVLLVFMAIYGAFIGPERAKAFFNSPVLSAYWLALTALLAGALVVFRWLVRPRGLLLIHAGCILVLVGAIWGSQAGLELRSRLLGTDNVQTGYMIIHEGDSENRISMEDSYRTVELPFHIKLKDFRVEFYKPEYLEIVTAQGRSKIPVAVGNTCSIGTDLGTITIVRVFENFRISSDGGKETVTDDRQAGYNPALEIMIQNPDKTIATRYVFEKFPNYTYPGDQFLLSYRRSIRDYISEVQVIKDGKVVAEKNIEVNHPLHFGGYHFYQSSYDTRAHRYTVLSVVSDSGLWLVYSGYLLLVAGVFWHFWLRRVFAKRRSEGGVNGY